MNTLSIVLVSLFVGVSVGILITVMLIPHNEIKSVHKYFELFNINLKNKENDNNREKNTGSEKQKHGNEKRQNRKHSTKGNNTIPRDSGNK